MTSRLLASSAQRSALTLFSLVALGCGLTAQQPINQSILEPRPLDAEQQARVAATPAGVVREAQGKVLHVFVRVDQELDAFKVERPSTGLVIDPSGLVVLHGSQILEIFGEQGGMAEGYSMWLQSGVDDKGEPLLVAATVVERNADNGLTLLRAELPEGQTLPAFELADPDAMQPGERVTVLCRHDGEKFSVFGGVGARASGGTTIAGVERRFEPSELILTDAPLPPVAQGAALVDAEGRLLGICDVTHVREIKGGSTLEELQRPNFGVALSAALIQSSFTSLKPELAGGVAESKLAAAVAKIADSVVGVRAGDSDLPEIGDLDPYAVRRRAGVGSGVFIDASGLLLTNAHLVHEAESITVRLADGRDMKAELLASVSDPRINLAVLRVALPEGETAPAIECGISDEVLLGEPVLGVGRPFGVLTVSAGVLSAVRGPFLQADPVLGNANGGGALIDSNGRLIAIVDGGWIDKIERAFREEGDDAKVETSLAQFFGIDAVRRILAEATQELVADSPFMAPAPADAEQVALRSDPVTAAVEVNANSLLNVYVSYTTYAEEVSDNPFATPEPKIMTLGLGSGVIIDRSGLAVSNWHVVDAAVEPDGSSLADHVVHVRLRDGRTFETEVLSISREDDLALLKLKLPEGEEIEAVEFGDSDALPQGETVIAVGNPHGQANTITVGVLSAKDQDIRVKGRWAKFEGLLETDAAINSGNSGGALLDINGRLVGINSAGAGGTSLTGYAIPVEHVRERLQNLLLSPEKLRSAYIGITVADKDGGVVVKSVTEGSPAARAGLLVGDKLISMDGVPLRWSFGYADALRGKPGFAPINLQVGRGAESLTLPVVPLSAASWAVLRQTGLECEPLNFRDNSELILAAARAAERQFSGVPTDEPRVIPETLVQIAEAHAGRVGASDPIEPGALFLGVEYQERNGATKIKSLRRFTTVEEIQDFFNSASSYEGEEFTAWIYQDGAVQIVGLRAERLML